jgi:hypothetical protein
MSVKACASITALVQPTKPGARPIPRPAATINVLIYLKRFGAMASTSKYLAQMSKSPAVGKATKKRSALRVQSGKGPTSRHLLDINRSHTSC